MIEIPEADLGHCSEFVRERDKSVWLATLLMPQPLRDATVVLRAFHCEIVSIARIVSEPIAGEMRLQWWADAVAGNRSEEASGHPVARALRALIGKYELPLQAFDAKIAAHVFDLYADPMGPRDMFEGYAGETRSALYQLTWLCADRDGFAERATASGHAGIVETVADILAQLPGLFQGQRVYLPSDLLSAAGFDVLSFIAAEKPARVPVIQAFVDYGLDHLSKARLAISQAERDGNGAHLAYLPLVASERTLLAAQANPLAVQSTPQRISPLRIQWAMWRAARSGRI